MELAAKARSDEMRSIRMHLGDEDMREQMLKALDERGGAQELIRQQYSGRYPFELLQNADDAARESGRRGRARFLLTDTALLIADNGTGFGAKQVKAICSLGRSSKGPGTSIGHKGLGFKSVGEITERPQVLSTGEQFQFDAARVRADLTKEFGELSSAQRFPTYAFPYPLDMDDLGDDAAAISSLQADGFTTVVRLPLKQEVDRDIVAEHLAENLHPRLLLFLPSTDHLELRGTDQDFSAEVARHRVDGVEQVLLETDAVEEWRVYCSSITPTDDALAPMGEEWAKIRELKFAIAVPFDPETNQPTLDETFPLHVYFPTEETPGFRVAVHAEWVLTMDRRRIAETAEAAELNRQILEAVTDFAAHTVAVDLVQRCEMSAESVQALIPTAQGQIDGTAGEIADAWRSTLASVPFLPLANGNLGCPTEVRLLPVSGPDLDQAHELANLAPDESLRPDVERAEGVGAFVACVSDDARMAEAEFLSLLNAPTLSDAHDFYSFLVAWYDRAGHGLLDALKATKCIITTNGDVLAPDDQTIFFPRQDESLPDDIPVPIAEVPSVDGLVRMLRDLDVKAFEWRDLIGKYLIPILGRADAEPVERDRAMRSLRAYQSVRTTAGDVASEVLGRVLIPARNSAGTTTTLRRANRIYFGSNWTGSVDLEEIYGPFDEAEFLNVEVPEDTESREWEESFYRMLGVVDHPRLQQAGIYDIDAVRHPHRGPLFSEWLNHARAWSCTQGHDPKYQKLQRSLRLDRHQELVDSEDPRRLFALWNQLARNWGRVYEDAMRTTVRCINNNHRVGNDRSIDSLFGYTLRSRPWVPVEVDGKPEVVRPGQAWVDTAMLPTGIRKRIPHISESMYRSRGSRDMAAELRLIEAGHPTVDNLLTLLEVIAAEADHEGVTNQEIDLAARWVQRTLHDVLSANVAPHPSPEEVRVLATYRGQTCFVSQPFFIEDPTLRATWQDAAPVLLTDVGDTRFAKYLGLVRLDDEVAVLPQPIGERRDARSARAVERIDAAKPFIAALIHSENSRAGIRVLRVLRNLELVFCDGLTLRYRYDGQQVQRDDAVCHIATRKQQDGRKNLSVGTAFVVLDADTGAPDWFGFGRQLAQHLGVPDHFDAITMLLKVDSADRFCMMADRQIPMTAVNEAASALELVLDEDEEPSSVLDRLLSTAPEPTDDVAVLVSSEDQAKVMTGDPEKRSGDGAPTTADDEPGRAEPPPVDYAAVSIVDAIPVEVLPAKGSPGSRPAGVAIRASSAPPIGNESERRRIGKRGEEIAYTKERERLTELGLDPDVVTWESATDELAPYDILSFDGDGQRIYIEVKATTGSDPTEPFYISRAELIEAGVHGDRYYIYRVTDVDTAQPRITRWANPMRLVKNQQGQLLMTSAQMELGLDRPEE